MPRILTPKEKIIPPVFPEINWTNPIARGLIFDAPLITNRPNQTEILETVSKKVGRIEGGNFWATPVSATAGFRQVGGRVLDFNATGPRRVLFDPTTGNGIGMLAKPPVQISVEVLLTRRTGGGQGGYGSAVMFGNYNNVEYFAIQNDNFDAGWGIRLNTFLTDAERVWSVNYPTNNTWHHYVVTRDYSDSFSNVPIVWKNGLSDGVTDRFNGGAAWLPFGETVAIGNNIYTASDSAWSGQIAYVRIWNRLLTRIEARSLQSDPWQIYKKPLYETAGRYIVITPPVGNTLSISKSENISVTESVNMFTDRYHLSVSDSITVSENTSLTVAGSTDLLVNVSESITVSESTKSELNSFVNVSNNVYVFEGRNVVSNYTFESDSVGDGNIPSGWSSFGSGQDTYKGVANDYATDGSNSFKISSTVNCDTGMRINLTGLVSGRSYTVSIWGKTTSDVTTASFVLSNEQNASGGNQTTSDNWSGEFEGRRSITWTPNTTSWEIFLGMGAFGPTSAGNVWFDDIKVQVYDTIAISTDLAISVSDSITVSESVQTELNSFINVSDSITVSENSVVAFESTDRNVSVSDNVTVSEATKVELNSFISKSDSITVTESSKTELNSNITVSDSITVTESIQRMLEAYISKSENITVTESVQRMLESYINKTENITVTESVAIFQPFLTIQVSDSITVSEAVAAFIGQGNSVFDMVMVSENTVVDIPINISVSDSVTVSELVNTTLVHNLAVSDSVTVSENRKVELESIISASDSITVTESVTVSIPTLFLNVSDSIAVSESIATFLTIDQTISDSITVTDTPNITLVHDRTVSDSITVSESIKMLLESSVSVSDAVVVDDQAVLTNAYSVGVSENVTVSESVTLDIPLNISVSDNVTITESVLLEKNFIVVSDSITVSENVSLLIPTLFVSVSDSITVTESSSVAFVWLINKSESITVSEAILVGEPHEVEEIAPKLILVDGQLAYLIVDQGIPYYTRV